MRESKRKEAVTSNRNTRVEFFRVLCFFLGGERAD